MKGSRKKATDVLEVWYCSHDMHSFRRMLRTIVRVLLPKISWKHKEGATLKDAATVPSELQDGTTAFGNDIREEVGGELRGQTEKLKRSVLSSWEIIIIIIRRKRSRLEEGTSGSKRENITFQIRHFYLQPKWWTPAKVKTTKKEKKTVIPIKVNIGTYIYISLYIYKLRSLSPFLTVTIIREWHGMIKIVMLCKLLLMVVLQEKQWHTICIAQIKFLSIPLKDKLCKTDFRWSCHCYV